MTLRAFALLGAVLALGAAIAWFWLMPEQPVSERGKGTTARDPNPTTPGAGEAVNKTGAGAVRSGTSATPGEPLQMTSSVLAGAPMVRTTPSPTMATPVPRPTGGAVPQVRRELQPEARQDIESVQMMLRDFRTRLGENPVGSNAEIMRAVMGGNEKKARLGPPPDQSLNEAGELLDRWGTPYFFHQLSRTSMEVRSAGPDQRLWTADDVVTK